MPRDELFVPFLTLIQIESFIYCRPLSHLPKLVVDPELAVSQRGR